MPRPKRGPRLGAGPAHQRLLLAGLAAQLFTHERVNTTQAKAKAVRPLAEKLITSATRVDLPARREVLMVIPDRDVVHKHITDIGPRYAERPGGYTRILKLGARQGDGAAMARIELVASEE
jgi:large subunit ribosomal protein L17